MKIHEYQAKELLRRYGIATPRGFACFSVDEAVAAAQSLGGPVWVVKAQIHAGGRGKGGGVKLARSLAEVRQHAGQMLGMMLKTHQTGPEGQKVRRLLIEEGVDIAKELYAGMVVDRVSQRVCLMASSEGGMDIEHVAATAPDKIHKVFIDPMAGLTDADADAIAGKIGIPDASLPQARSQLQALYKAFDESDASLAEINPLILTRGGDVVALDAKFNLDDNALFRHPDIVALRDLDEEDPAEVEASKHELNYIALDGNIACLVNGAGLAMATMDITKHYGGSPANFLDVGGGATAERVTGAFTIMLQNPRVKAILVNIFGGIMRCDVLAEGIVEAARKVKLSVPLIVRMEGTNVDAGRKILADSGLPIISASSMEDAARKAVKAAGQAPVTASNKTGAEPKARASRNKSVKRTKRTKRKSATASRSNKRSAAKQAAKAKPSRKSKPKPKAKVKSKPKSKAPSNSKRGAGKKRLRAAAKTVSRRGTARGRAARNVAARGKRK